MKSIKNWDNNTWLSSKNYINSFNLFLIKNLKLNKYSKILDIGCGRGKIVGTLYSQLKLKSKPIGIDIENHKDKDQRIIFNKSDAIKFLSKRIFFDLIIIKQTIHLLKINQIKKLIKLCKNSLNKDGKIIILTLDSYNNQIPTFKLMQYKLQKSLIRDKKIINFIKKNNKNLKTKKFVYDVNIFKSKYLEMVKERYISILINMSSKQILDGINELNNNFNKKIKFKDKLQCIILKK